MSSFDSVTNINQIENFIINIQNDFGVQGAGPEPEPEPPIFEIENEMHDCVIDISDSQPEDEIISATLALEDELLANLVTPSSEATDKPAKVTMGIAVKALGKGQDAPYCGSFVDECGTKGDYVALYDGHGENDCINSIRGFNQDEIMADTNPVNSVREKISNYRTSRHCDMANSGSTFVYAKIVTENSDGSGLGYISIGNVGDSELAVYINGERVFMTTPQIAKTPGEMERLKKENRVRHFTTNDETKPKVHADGKLTMEKAYSINFLGMKPLVPSQSLGHNELTGYEPETKIMTFDLATDRVRVVAGSDGLWDLLNLDVPEDNEAVLTMDADFLCEFAEGKWKQEWKYCTNSSNMESFRVTSFPKNGYDDIGLAIYDYIPPQSLGKVELN